MAVSRMHLLAATLCAGLTLSAGARADTLLLDNLAQQAAQARPARGMNMDAVEQRFGAPVLRMAAVGQPPISRWEYPGFIVYFEHSLVIHAVVKRDGA